MPKLDLIVTHYNEPAETGWKLFEMLNLQRMVNFTDFRVTIVQDGKEGSLDWKEMLEGYPYDIRVITIKHAGVSAARNVGIEESDAEWLMFVDFDDTFSGVYSLRRFFESMSDDVDMVYCHLTGENISNGSTILEPYYGNDTFIHGKMFRRQWLIDNDLTFEEGCTFSEDTLFCHVMRTRLNPMRVHEIKENLFAHCWYEGSVCKNMENNFRNAVGVFVARKALAREYRKRGKPNNYIATVIKTIWDYYYAINSGGYPEPEWFEKDFFAFWQEYKDVFQFADRGLFTLEKNIAHDEAANKGFVMAENITIWDWIERMERKYGGRTTDIGCTDTRYPRIAVYHGTRNTYQDMLACAKSLLIHSNVEKIYFVTEDDEFPYPLPDGIEIKNLSGQKYIRTDSPNYDCAWTWMVMLRAAFPKIFPEHDVILSLDVDTIVDRNIDRIWDTDLTDCYYAAVKETKSSEFYGRLHTNMGVCLMNLAKMREDGMDDRILEELNTVKHAFTEQDVFNEFCQGNIKELSSEYNVCAYTARPETERIIHFAGFRGGQTHALIERYKAMSLDDVKEMKKQQMTL